LIICNPSSFCSRSIEMMFSILLQHHISKLRQSVLHNVYRHTTNANLHEHQLQRRIRKVMEIIHRQRTSASKPAARKICENIYNSEQPLSGRHKRSEWTMKNERTENAETETQPTLEHLQHGFKYIHPKGKGSYGDKMFRCAGVWTKYVYQTVKRKSTFYAEVLPKPMSSEAVLSGS
jgi:hypothetical protein